MQSVELGVSMIYIFLKQERLACFYNTVLMAPPPRDHLVTHRKNRIYRLFHPNGKCCEYLATKA